MKSVVRYFIKNSFIVNLISVFVCVSGIVALSSMQRDLIPPFQWQVVNVNISLPGASPQEMEKFVTFPIEEATRGLRGIDRVESTSRMGSTQIRFYYTSDHENMAEAADMIQARINSIRSQLPDSILTSTVERSQVNEIFLFWLGVEGFDEENQEHRLLIDRFSQELLDIKGVVNINEGFRKRDITIEFDTKKLKAAEISLVTARQVLNQALRVGPIGEALIREDRYTVTLDRSIHRIDDLAKLPVRSNRSGQALTLGDLASVEYRLEEGEASQYINKKPGTYLVVLKDINSDTIDLKPKVLEVVERFNSSHDQFKIVTLMDGPHFLEQQIDVLFKNGLLGLCLVILVLMFFLNFKTAVMTGLGLVVAYTGTFIVLYLSGVSIDLLSIIGMILVVGILVDDAIIVAERYSSNLDLGESPQIAAEKSVLDLITPVTGTVLTTIVAFAPMIFIKSEISNILYAVPLVVISSLILSWIESFFILPNHLAHFVKNPSANNKRERLLSSLRSLYEKALRGCLKLRYIVIVILCVILAVGGYLGMKHLEHDFQLNINSEYVSVYAVLKESESSEETYQKIKELEGFLRSFKGEEIENVYTNIGRVWMNGENFEGARYAQINGYLNRNTKYPSKLKARIQSLVDKKIEKMNKDDFERLYSTIERQGESQEKGQMLSVRVRGSERVSFLEIEEVLVQEIERLEQVNEYIPKPDRYQESWIFKPNLLELARYDMTTIDLSEQMRGFFAPHLVQETRVAGESLRIFTRIKRERELELSNLSSLEIVTPSGLAVPLSFLGQWKQERSLKEISHYDGMRNLTMDFSVSEESNINTAIAEAKVVTERLKEQFPSYELAVTNANEQEVKSQAWALKVALVCIAGVLMVIALVLGSLSQPFLVGLPIPFSLVGIILALYLHGLPLGLMALVGLIGTVGVGVNASIVMVDQMNQNIKSSKRRLDRDSIILGASSRFRAILLTTLTTLAGVFPMAYALGGESGFTQPLAFALGWGVSFSTCLTLFALPALMAVREDMFSFKEYLLRKLPSSKT